MKSATTNRLRGAGLIALGALAVLGATVSVRGLAGEATKEVEAAVAPQLPGRYVHVALYTFKADAPKGTASAFAADAEKCFRQIPQIRGFRVGPPARQATPKADMVEPRGDYHIGVVLGFDGFGGLAKYGNHPRHNELKKKYAKFFDKIVVYDFEG